MKIRDLGLEIELLHESGEIQHSSVICLAIDFKIDTDSYNGFNKSEVKCKSVH